MDAENMENVVQSEDVGSPGTPIDVSGTESATDVDVDGEGNPINLDEAEAEAMEEEGGEVIAQGDYSDDVAAMISSAAEGTSDDGVSDDQDPAEDVEPEDSEDAPEDSNDAADQEDPLTVLNPIRKSLKVRKRLMLRSVKKNLIRQQRKVNRDGSSDVDAGPLGQQNPIPVMTLPLKNPLSVQRQDGVLPAGLRPPTPPTQGRSWLPLLLRMYQSVNCGKRPVKLLPRVVRQSVRILCEQGVTVKSFVCPVNVRPHVIRQGKSLSKSIPHGPVSSTLSAAIRSSRAK